MQKMQIVGSNQLQQVAKVAVDNASKTLAGLGVTVEKTAGTDGEIAEVAQGAVITVEDNTIQYGFGTVTNEAGTDVGHEAGSGDIITLESPREVAGYQFINKVSGSVANLQVDINY